MSLKIGVIGTGAIGREHANRLNNKIVGSTVTAVSDVFEESAQKVITDICPNAKFYADAIDLIKSDDVDAIVVTSPGFAHAEVVLEAIAFGKPVFCEKPLATEASDAKKIVDAEMAGGKKLVQVGFMRRYDAGYKMMKAAIDNGEIGEPLMIHAAHRNPEVPTSYKDNYAIQ